MPFPATFRSTRAFGPLACAICARLFNGRLASALGEWPWTDVFMSSETSNLLLSTLSASIVGIGDALGEFDRANLNRVIRADGVIVKPDDAIAPLDASCIEQANDRRLPIVATAHTRHQKSITSYVFLPSVTRSNTARHVSRPRRWSQRPVYAFNTSTDTECTSSRRMRLNLPFPTMAPTGSSSRSGPQAWDSWMARTP